MNQTSSSSGSMKLNVDSSPSSCTVMIFSSSPSTEEETTTVVNETISEYFQYYCFIEVKGMPR